ncbi:hypothetical protein K1718_02790 [Roseibium porphyridii]|uniref:HEAT repeat domain-containing protein n=1 Tax=Roseibium porphyridii TaxID=2866279 RepID=A0ABY8F486_9HYPH|nr:hypothetical protein [Roseibium sp. KMA01]WFE90296.1 hypothetical protein K1718_02790 [Roseibium sp. KMA01]
MSETLRTILSAWDGKDTGKLEALFESERANPVFVQALVGLCEIEDCQRSATWLLKRHFDLKGPPLPEDLTRQHLGLLAKISHWEAKLHVLQYFEKLQLSLAPYGELEGFVETGTRSDNKFVRAWAYYGLAVLALSYPEMIDRVRNILTDARDVETAGSVRVRIRKALEKLGN